MAARIAFILPHEELADVAREYRRKADLPFDVHVAMMEEAVPLAHDCIRIDEAYFAQGQGTQAQSYLEQCHAQAMQLRRSLERRSKTLLMYFETLVGAQQRFFFEGMPGLKSYTRRRIAQALKNICFACDYGIFHIDQMFPHSVSDEMESLLQDDVLREIRRLVDEEDPRRPLSDEKISLLLKMDGIVICRRTVAKCRDKLGIAGFYQRRISSDL